MKSFASFLKSILLFFKSFFFWYCGMYFSVGERDMDCCRNIGSDEYLHGAMAGKAGGNTIYNVRCHCVGILFLQIPKTFGKGGIHTAAVLQFSCVKLFDCRQYLSMYSGEHI